MSPCLTHVALHVRDLDACVEFYRRYCALKVVHERDDGDSRVVWLAEPGREQRFIFVLLSGGPGRNQDEHDYGHLGFAVQSRAAVDEIAARAAAEGCLEWPPHEEPFPVGYYCGVRDPDGIFVEFSYGQPLGPGADSAQQ
ncbi:VOC family protein [Haliangium sp.]|uniref:VOC family protein n=1 Tax=Haliangium sp. TaxID=2663208 RepID=UPI003D1178D1